MCPPQLQTGTVVRQWYRYRVVSQAATGEPVTVQTLINACGAVASTTGVAGTVTMYSIANAVRVRRIRAWCAAPAAGVIGGSVLQSNTAFATCSVDFDVQSSSVTATALQFTDTSMSPAVPAFIDVVPPQGCFASFWHNRAEGGSTVFIGQMGLSGIMDIELEWILGDADTASNFTNSQTVTAGLIYYPALSTTNTAYIPVGRQLA